jgi:hypothetical protein
MSAAVDLPGNYEGREETQGHQESDWLRIGGGVAMIAGSLLLLTRQRRLGLIVTATGTALAALEHRDVLAEWWEKLPQHLDKAQHMINQAQETIQDLSEKRDRIMGLFGK